MTKYPKRTGFKLTYDAECLYNDWEEHGGCSCHTGCTPCSSCCHEGNPVSLEETEEAWEIDEEVKDMSRSEIVDKGGSSGIHPPHPIWVAVKDLETLKVDCEVQVNGVETRITKLDHGMGGKVIGFYTSRDIFSDGNPKNFWGRHSRAGCDVWVRVAETSQPVKNEFKVGKYYKYILQGLGVFKTGKYYKLYKANGGLLFTEDMYQYMRKEAFDINSESDYDPTKEKLDTEVKSSKIDDILTVTITRETYVGNFNQQEDVNMTNVTRRVVNVKFFDEDAGLDVADSLVAFYDNVVTQDSDESTVRELLMNLDVAAKIEAHNKVRAKTVDLEILRNTGNEVTLRPIKLKDLRIEVTKA